MLQRNWKHMSAAKHHPTQIDIWKHSRNGIICMQRSRARNLKWVLLCMCERWTVAMLRLLQCDWMLECVCVWEREGKSVLIHGNHWKMVTRWAISQGTCQLWRFEFFFETIKSISLEQCSMYFFLSSIYFKAYNSLANRKILRKRKKNCQDRQLKGISRECERKLNCAQYRVAQKVNNDSALNLNTVFGTDTLWINSKWNDFGLKIIFAVLLLILFCSIFQSKVMIWIFPRLSVNCSNIRNKKKSTKMQTHKKCR